jgi:lipopolysaccharide/colanic/teichoic acid biosynthesis glycosyltransferase
MGETVKIWKGRELNHEVEGLIRRWGVGEESGPRTNCNAMNDFPRFPLWKRALDLTLVILSSPFWLPAMAVLGLIIKAVSPGPVFFRQERIGRGGRRFVCHKFRSMKTNAETRVHEDYLKRLIRTDSPMTKLDEWGDSRLIPMGRFFRSTGLDELPQLLNVIRGEMSLVGPRPCTPYEFQNALAFQASRIAAPPGLTGYWQVNGKNKTTFREMIAMDNFYANHMSLQLDLRILFQTFPAIIKQVVATRGGDLEVKKAADKPAVG